MFQLVTDVFLENKFHIESQHVSPCDGVFV